MFDFLFFQSLCLRNVCSQRLSDTFPRNELPLLPIAVCNRQISWPLSKSVLVGRRAPQASAVFFPVQTRPSTFTAAEMQTPKARAGSSAASPATPRAARQLKSTASDSESTTSPHSGSRASQDRSPKPKIPEHKSPKSPLSEKRPMKASELQQQLVQAQEDSKKTKELLASAETAKAQALQDLQEARQLVEETNVKLSEAEKKAFESIEIEKARALDLQQASLEAGKERDKAWQAELEAVERQHAMDVAALLSTTQELQRVKHELCLSMDSKAMALAQVEEANKEIECLKQEIGNLKLPESKLLETHTLLETLKRELTEARASEANATMIAREANFNLEEARMKIDSVKSEEIKASESLRSVTLKLEEAKAGLKKGKIDVDSLTETVHALKVELEGSKAELVEAQKREEQWISKASEGEEMNKKAVENLELDLHQSTAEAGQAKIELEIAYEEAQNAKLEVEKLKATLKNVEKKFEAMLGEARAETEHAKAAAERAKLEAIESLAESNARESKLMLSLREAEAKANAAKEDLEKTRMEVADLKASLMDKENELQNIAEENEGLKSSETAALEKIEQLQKLVVKPQNSISSSSQGDFDSVNKKVQETDALVQEKITEALARVEIATAKEQEALEKLNVANVELEKSNQRANRSLEQLEAAQAASLAMEADMKRLKIQTEQWRKAADAAATVLAAAHNGELNGKVVERSASLDKHLLSDSNVLNVKLTSPIKSDDMDHIDNSPTTKKKNAMLRRFGDLWKKRSQK